MQTEVTTVCGFARIDWNWRFYFRRWPDIGDEWRRYALRAGPFYLSWSVAR